MLRKKLGIILIKKLRKFILSIVLKTLANKSLNLYLTYCSKYQGLENA